MSEMFGIIAEDLQRSSALLLQNYEDSITIAITRIESILLTLTELQTTIVPEQQQIILNVMNLLQKSVDILILAVEGPILQERGAIGRPKLSIPICQLEFLLSMRLKVADIANYYGVSRETIHGRMKESGLSVSATYTNISDADLHTEISKILNDFPTTGYKRMKGYLRAKGIHVTDIRVRAAMRVVDPEGVYYRTVRRNRTIRRRTYFVEYSNQMWHIDGNLKLIRWKFVIRCGIDGKSRCVTYISATGDNKAETHLPSFLDGVRKYGIPLHTRSDKGGENVLIAKFMLEQRGTGRRSHICGRSVHNQRIERFWGEVWEGYTSTYYSLFSKMEEEGILDVDNPYHIWVLHYIFLPRINQNLQTFIEAWNNHPLSTESNKSPIQLMLTNLPPPDMDLVLPLDEQENLDFSCENYEDLGRFDEIAFNEDASLPNVVELERKLEQIDRNRPSNCFGYDTFISAMEKIYNNTT